MNQNHNEEPDSGIYIPYTASPNAQQIEAEGAEAIDKLNPVQLVAHLFRCVANLARGLSGYSPKHLQKMMEAFDEGAEVAAVTKCGCPSCMIRLDYIRMLGQPLLDAVRKVFEAAELMRPRLQAEAERAQLKSKAKARIGTELIQLQESGKLGLS